MVSIFQNGISENTKYVIKDSFYGQSKLMHKRVLLAILFAHVYIHKPDCLIVGHMYTVAIHGAMHKISL